MAEKKEKALEKNKEIIPLKPGTFFCGYRIDRVIGKGGYGVVYLVYDFKSSKPLAMKTELSMSKKRGLRNEINVQSQLENKGYFLEYIDSGESEGIRFVVMELLGPSLSKVMRSCPNNHLSPATWIATAKEMLFCIKCFHQQWFIHRDIKPGNFLLRGFPNDEHFIVLIDYGMAKEYVDPFTKEVKKQRTVRKFLGTTKYCSLYTHTHVDQSRRDDLLCWFYSIVELYLGKLPWSDIEDKNQIKNSKLIFCQNMRNCLPKPIVKIYRILNNLNFTETPDYDILFQLLDYCYQDFGVEKTTDYDWLHFDEKTQKKISSFSLNKSHLELFTYTQEEEEEAKQEEVQQQNKEEEPQEQNQTKSKTCLLI